MVDANGRMNCYSNYGFERINTRTMTLSDCIRSHGNVNRILIYTYLNHFIHLFMPYQPYLELSTNNNHPLIHIMARSHQQSRKTKSKKGSTQTIAQASTSTSTSATDVEQLLGLYFTSLLEVSILTPSVTLLCSILNHCSMFLRNNPCYTHAFECPS